jgi:hypothetical protein
MRFWKINFIILPVHGPTIGPDESTYDIKECGFTSAIGADQTYDFTWFNR